MDRWTEKVTYKRWVPHPKIIDILKSPQVMSFPDFEKPCTLRSSVSGLGFGAVLCQKQDNKLKVISYVSRTLTPAEKNYHLHSVKLKFFALKWAVTDKFRYLLHGPACCMWF